jgi:hypothetical protein
MVENLLARAIDSPALSYFLKGLLLRKEGTKRSNTIH